MKPLVFGLSGLTLSEEERKFFQEQKPYGFILFTRNCDSKEQIIKLTTSLRNLFPDNKDLRIMIDQEGGRVARLKAPILSRNYPSASYFTRKSDDRIVKKEVFYNYYDMMEELVALGINTNCAPVVDLFFEDASDIIGDRSFGSNPEIVASLAGFVLNSMKVTGGAGIIKHIPGHGRATCDSHFELPVVKASLEELEETDFKVFSLISKNLDADLAMTAHIIYEALDPQNPATLSKIVIDYIRKKIGFSGKIITDDISMKALSGKLSERTKAAFEAGCDIVLHCNGNMEEMIEIARSYDEYAASLGDADV